MASIDTDSAGARLDRLAAGPAALVATSLRRLTAFAGISCSLAVGYGFAADWWISEYSEAPLLNVVLIALQLFLVLLGGWGVGMLVCSLALGPVWRRRALLGERVVDDLDLPDIRSFNEGPAFVAFATFVGCALLYAAIHVGTGDWIGRYNQSGAYITMLRTSDPAVRVQALRDLVHPIREVDASRVDVRLAVSGALTDPDREVRTYAAWACGHLIVVDCQTGLLPLLDSEDPAEFAQAAFALGRLRDALGERRMLELLPQALGDDERTGALMTGLGLMASVQGAEQLASMLGLLPPELEAVALWAIGQSRTTSQRARVLSLDPGDDLARSCAIAEALKHVTTLEDDGWLREAFHSTPRGQMCEEVVLLDLEYTEGRRREDIRYVIGEDLREKYLRAVFNVAGPRLEPWLQEVVYDEAEDLALRLLAERMLKLLEGAPARLPRE